jgi:hypothetical protein
MASDANEAGGLASSGCGTRPVVLIRRSTATGPPRQGTLSTTILLRPAAVPALAASTQVNISKIDNFEKKLRNPDFSPKHRGRLFKNT